MDFHVEATVLLSDFQDETEVVEILRSCGLKTVDCDKSKVRVHGSFLKLKAAKTRLEQLLYTQNLINVNSSSPASSGAVPKKHYASRSRNKPPHASASSSNTSASQVSDASHCHPSSPQYRAAAAVRPDQRGSVRQESESFVVEGDVFKYADRLRKKDIQDILVNHSVTIGVMEADESFHITLVGQCARTAAAELQSFLNNLTTSLRTQEVLRKDMSHKGEVVLQDIRKNRGICYSVLVCEMNDRLHLIGPSAESYELKQRLLGKSVDRSGRRGRTNDRISRKRSSSLPAVNRKSTDRDSDAIAQPSPAGASGYSPSKYKDDKQEDADGGASRRRTHSESRENKQAKSRNGYAQETENKQQHPKTPTVRKSLLPSRLDPRNMKDVFKGWSKKTK